MKFHLLRIGGDVVTGDRRSEDEKTPLLSTPLAEERDPLGGYN